MGADAARASAPTTRYQPAQRVVAQVLDGKVLLLTPDATDLVTLNPLGSAVWSLLNEPREVAAIVRSLAAQWPDVPADAIDADVRSFLTDLESQGLLERC